MLTVEVVVEPYSVVGVVVGLKLYHWNDIKAGRLDWCYFVLSLIVIVIAIEAHRRGLVFLYLLHCRSMRITNNHTFDEYFPHINMFAKSHFFHKNVKIQKSLITAVLSIHTLRLLSMPCWWFPFEKNDFDYNNKKSLFEKCATIYCHSGV